VRVALLDGPLLALEHLGDGDLLLLSPPAGAHILPDGSVLRDFGVDLQIAQDGTLLTFLRQKARDLAAVIAEMNSLAADLAAF
jgi:hypothetical protein